MKNIKQMLKRLWEKGKKSLKFGATSAEYIQWQRKIFIERCTTSLSVNESKKGRPRKRFSNDTCPRTENEILDNIINQRHQSALDKNVSPESLMVLLEKRMGLSLTGTKKIEIPAKDACAIMYNIDLSTSQYLQLRMFMKQHDIHLLKCLLVITMF